LFSYPLDLTCVLWEAEHKDGTIIHKGPQKYPLIDRSQLESFSLTWRNKPILTVHPKDRTLILRLKTLMMTFIVSGDSKVKGRVWILALLAKPKSESTTQHVDCDLGLFPGEKKNRHQYYDIDKEDSNIYYLYENGKQEIRNKFGTMSPYLSLHLRPDEFKHLMGRDE